MALKAIALMSPLPSQGLKFVGNQKPLSMAKTPSGVCGRVSNETLDLKSQLLMGKPDHGGEDEALSNYN